MDFTYRPQHNDFNGTLTPDEVDIIVNALNYTAHEAAILSYNVGRQLGFNSTAHTESIEAVAKINDVRDHMKGIAVDARDRVASVRHFLTEGAKS